MPTTRRPRKGSMQFWPRSRARRIYPKVKSNSKLTETKIIAFPGYKAGMTHTTLLDQNPKSLTNNQEIFCPVTIIECPPIKPFSLRFYKKTPDGLKLISEIISKKLDKEFKRKIKFPKKDPKPLIEQFDDLRIAFYTQPRLTTIGKKKPEILEIPISGSKEKKLEYAKSLLEKEIKISDIFKEYQFVDVHAVTKGKGFQGPIKRFHLKLKSHKSEKKRRSGGNLGAWTPKKVSHTVPQAGSMGFNTRTEYNKLILKIDSDQKIILPKSGIPHYGLIKNDYLLIKGSIPGPKKRTIILTEPIKARKQLTYEINYISK